MPTRSPVFAARVLLFAAAVPLLLRLVKLPRLNAWLEPKAPPAPPMGPETAEELIERLDRLIRLGRPVVRWGCLVRGLTLYRFLREAGFDVALCFGIGRVDGREGFTGHCWIEKDGKVLAEKRDPRPIYVETFRIGPSPPSPLPASPSPLPGRGG
jgi:hypothetical protein